MWYHSWGQVKQPAASARATDSPAGCPRGFRFLALDLERRILSPNLADALIGGSCTSEREDGERGGVPAGGLVSGGHVQASVSVRSCRGQLPKKETMGILAPPC